jgi:DNA-binding response OmpR family regulator
MKKVLVIEDETPIRDNLRRFLSLEGYLVVTAENGAVGVELARREVPDLVFCDVMMPELNGYQVLSIMQGDPRLAGIPFVFLTASAEKENMVQGLALGAWAYVTKPFDLAELASRLKNDWLPSVCA